ncbi:MFS transporter [Leekyejoonella antrihumi]|uniref:MFS transporter n=2 Tax=Leekyejoonella antrihumi TaxID=1660198 RepID=A0A563EA37_9MICO|nr:MFS transporter [Leekyejoonella antrihumi]
MATNVSKLFTTKSPSENIPTFSPRDVTTANWICFFAWTFAVYDFVLFGNLLPKIAHVFGWSSSTSTAINTWVTAGTAVVAFAIGPFVDKVGRKKGIVVAVIGAAIFSLATAAVGWLAAVAAAFGAVLLIVFRSLAGLGYSEQAISATYLGEIYSRAYTTPAQIRRRGFIYSLVQSGWPVGSVLAAVSIDIILPISSWEWCFIVSVFPAIFMIIAARYLKESPVFAARRELERLQLAGKTDEARALANSQGLTLTETRTPIVEVFRGESLRPALTIGLSFLLSWLGVLAFDILGTSFLTAPDGKNITFNNSIEILAIANGTAFVGYLFFGWLGDRIGRRDAIGIGWLLCGASFLALVLVPNGMFALIIVLYSAGLFFLIGPYAALLFFSAESFPTRTRATGGALINAAGQIGSIIAGVLITVSLSSGWTWTSSVLYWGVLPIFASGILIWFARKTDSDSARGD